MAASTSALRELQLSEEELAEMLKAQPSLRAALVGHTARLKLKKLLTSSVAHIDQQDDHDRTRRGSITVHYKKQPIAIRSCSLQTNSIKNGIASFQCDGSDKRKVELPNGKWVETTCVLVGSFDIVAVALFAATGEWEFAFAPANSLRTMENNTRCRLPQHARSHLLATAHKITIPIRPPFTEDYVSLFDSVVQERAKANVKKSTPA